MPINDLTLSVNGQPHRVSADPQTPLLWVLRDVLGLRGTKFGCGRGICGACTVHVDGQARRACVTTIQSVARQRITTIEGLSPDGSHPVQRAWMEVDVPQCGYCQAGQIMLAASFLSANPTPSDAEVLKTMSANLCRCGTYLRIRQAIRRAVELGRSASAVAQDASS
jgi:isoquinoline 1-oxidoreductase alpha subunit